MPGTTSITISGPDVERQDEVLTAEALAFVAALHERFAPRRDELLTDLLCHVYGTLAAQNG